MTKPRILMLSRNYPSPVMPHMGLWVEGLVRHLGEHCDVRVVAPVPYCPPLPDRFGISQYRRIPSVDQVNHATVLRPRFLTGPGYSLHSFEGDTYYWGVRRAVDRLKREFPFDLIHAQFTYPDGAAAARLARRYGVPLVITEHAPWDPWMHRFPRVRRQAVAAHRQCAVHLAVSRYVRATITEFTGESERLRVLPVGVDSEVFTPPLMGETRDPDRIVYVGRIHRTKGVDVLLRAMRRVVDRRPRTRLTLVGGGMIFRDYQIQERELIRLSEELGLSDNVEFVGMKSPAEVAEYMRRSALLVLPSRAESFGAVLIEAMACGTPVIATRCGGPEDILTDGVGVMVPPEDEEAMAHAILESLQRPGSHDSAALRDHAIENFDWRRIAAKTHELYAEALAPESVRTEQVRVAR